MALGDIAAQALINNAAAPSPLSQLSDIKAKKAAAEMEAQKFGLEQYKAQTSRKDVDAKVKEIDDKVKRFAEQAKLRQQAMEGASPEIQRALQAEGGGAAGTAQAIAQAATRQTPTPDKYSGVMQGIEAMNIPREQKDAMIKAWVESEMAYNKNRGTSGSVFTDAPPYSENTQYFEQNPVVDELGDKDNQRKAQLDIHQLITDMTLSFKTAKVPVDPNQIRRDLDAELAANKDKYVIKGGWLPGTPNDQLNIDALNQWARQYTKAVLAGKQPSVGQATKTSPEVMNANTNGRRAIMSDGREIYDTPKGWVYGDGTPVQ